MNRETENLIQEFVIERDWDQFHSPENLAKSIVIEAAELLEHYQWGGKPDPIKVREEIADIIIYAYLFASKNGLDVDDVVREKVQKNREKYPVEKAKGSSKKYTEYDA